jgi:hypothetical protein
LPKAITNQRWFYNTIASNHPSHDLAEILGIDECVAKIIIHLAYTIEKKDTIKKKVKLLLYFILLTMILYKLNF